MAELATAKGRARAVGRVEPRFATFRETTLGSSGIGPLEWYFDSPTYPVDGAAGAVDTNQIKSPVIGFILDAKGLMYNLTLEGSKISRIRKE